MFLYSNFLKYYFLDTVEIKYDFINFNFKIFILVKAAVTGIVNKIL
jgi:hypothetical protein